MLKIQPKVTVLMAFHNDERYLEKALESVLCQSMTNFELLVVDDCSTDSSPSILSRFSSDKRVRSFRNDERMGLTLSLNRGLDFASGKYIARLDSDDLASPDRLDFQTRVMDGTSASLFASACTVIDSEGKCLHTHSPPLDSTRLKWLLIFRNPIRHSTTMWRNKGFKYNSSYKYSQDYELWSRIGDMAVSDRVVGAVRTHGASISAAKTEEQDEFATLVTKSIAEEYLGRGLKLEDVKNLRAICVHKHHLQHARLERMSQDEFKTAISIYFDIAEQFVIKEKPDLSVLRGEIMADLNGVAKTQPRFKEIIDKEINPA